MLPGGQIDDDEENHAKACLEPGSFTAVYSHAQPAAIYVTPTMFVAF